MDNYDLTPEEMAELQKFVGAGAPVQDEKHNVHTFLNKVAVSEDTTKTGYLKDEEVGTPRHPIRTHKGMALISDKVMDNDYFKKFFLAESEIITSTSLSRDAKLLELAVVTRRELADVTKKKRTQKGWFKKKDEKEESEK